MRIQGRRDGSQGDMSFFCSADTDIDIDAKLSSA